MKATKVLKLLALGLALTLAFPLAIGCTPAPEKPAKETEASGTPVKETIKVGVCAGPYEDLFREAIEPTLVSQGYTVEYVQFSDYVQPNKALADGEINVNIFQHSVYLENFKTEHNLDLVWVTEIPTAGMGIFSEKLTSLKDIPDGATIAIPNDVTNLARAIRVLEQAGLVKIDPSVNPAEATQFTLSENPKNLQFTEIEAPQLPRSLESVDVAIINGNFALSAGLDLAAALYNEKLGEGYVNVIAVRTEDKNAEFTKDIVAAVHSDAFRSVINDATNQYSAFHKPKDF